MWGIASAIVLLTLTLSVAGCGADEPATAGGEVTITLPGQTSSTTIEPATTTEKPATTTEEPATTEQSVTTSEEPVTTTAASITITSQTQTTQTKPALSDDALAYAKSIGGKSQKGKHLYLAIGASVKTEAEAQVLLDKATPKFGDMQSYYIVQYSNNFQGLNPGWYVLIEAYKDPPDIYNLDFGRRAFPDLYVKAVTVKTSDPIPVYEDQ
jgi:hypothetical protein